MTREPCPGCGLIYEHRAGCPRFDDISEGRIPQNGGGQAASPRFGMIGWRFRIFWPPTPEWEGSVSPVPSIGLEYRLQINDVDADDRVGLVVWSEGNELRWSADVEIVPVDPTGLPG